MNLKHAAIICCAACIVFNATRAIAADQAGQERKKGMAGIASNCIAVGIQAEYRFISPLALRFMGTYVYGLGKKHGPIVSKGEHLFSAVATPAVYIPTPVDFLVPVLYFGLSYSRYYWKSPYFKINGIINDVTFGGGAGLGFIVAPFCRIGVNCWINYDYKIKQEYGMKKKGKRCALVMPFLDVSFLF